MSCVLASALGLREWTCESFKSRLASRDPAEVLSGSSCCTPLHPAFRLHFCGPWEQFIQLQFAEREWLIFSNINSWSTFKNNFYSLPNFGSLKGINVDILWNIELEAILRILNLASLERRWKVKQCYLRCWNVNKAPCGVRGSTTPGELWIYT